MSAEREVRYTVTITDGGQLSSAMRKWLYGHTDDQEQVALLAAGYLKLIPGGHGQLGATAKGWREAQNPKRISEDAASYLATVTRRDTARLDAYARFAREVQRAVEEEDDYHPLKQALRAATTVLHDKLLMASAVSEKPADVYAPDDDPRGGKLDPGTTIVAMCPKCNGTEIGEHNVAYALLDVTEWEVGADGHASPAAYDGDNDAEWMTADEVDLYECRSCGWKGDLAELVYRAKTEED